MVTFLKFCTLDFFMTFVVRQVFFSKLAFSTNSFRNTIVRVSNSLIHTRTDDMAQIWVQAICKGDQQMTSSCAVSPEPLVYGFLAYDTEI